MRYKVLVVTGIIIAILVSGFFYVKGTPHYSLFQLKRAVSNHDPDEALKYINIDSIVDNLGKSLFGKEGDKADQGAGKRPSIRGLLADAMPGIKESVMSSFRTSIASRDEEKYREKASGQPRKDPASSVGTIEIGGLDLRKLKETSLRDIAIQRDGRAAIVSLKNNSAIRAKMVQTDEGYWQVVEIMLSP